MITKLKNLIVVRPEAVTLSPALERFCHLHLSGIRNWHNSILYDEAMSLAQRFTDQRLELYKEFGTETSPGTFNFEQPKYVELQAQINEILDSEVELKYSAFVVALTDSDGLRISEGLNGGEQSALRWLVTITNDEKSEKTE